MFAEQLEGRLLLISPELDFSFGAGGITSLDTIGAISDFRMLPGGKFMALGRASSSPPLTFIARFNGDGTLDRTFDGDGLLTLRIPGGGIFAPDGRILQLSTDGRRTTVQRLNTDGSADNSYGSNGSVTFDLIMRDLVVLPDGRLVFTSGKFDTPQIVVRLNADGSVDESFRGGIAAAVPLPADVLQVGDVAVAPEGKIYFLGDGVPNDRAHSLIGRLNADGTADAGFAGGGLVMVTDPALPPEPGFGGALRSPGTRLSEIYVDAQGRPVVVSQLNTGDVDHTRIVSRFTTSGARDATFGGGDGWIDLDDDEYGDPLAFTGDGKLLLATSSSLLNYQMTLRQLNTDGTPDTTFGEAGVRSFARDTFRPTRIVFDQAGNPLLSGVADVTLSQRTVPAIARLVSVSDNVFLNSDGVLSIDGTGGHDTVSLERSGDQVIVRRNGVTRSFAGSTLKKIQFWGYTGNDTVTVPFALDAELHGAAGDDTFTLGDGDVTIDAGSGAATIVAGNGKHVIVVGNGANSITLGSGTDFISAGSGNDTMVLGDGNDSILAGDGDDSIITGSGNDTIYTGHGNDEVAAGAGDDVVQAFQSQIPFDALPHVPEFVPSRDGGNGRKLYFGEAGDDFLVGGSEDSRLLGGEGADEINTNEGNDSISAGGGDDTVFGGPGNDTVNAGSGHDVVHGDHDWRPGVGDDLLLGGDGDDALYGEGGNDTLHGGTGLNVLDAGSGDDQVDPLPGLSVAGGLLSYDGSDATDEISISSEGGSIVVWLAGTIQRFASSEVTRIALSGNGGNDVLKLHRSLRIAATLDGGAGDDVLLGGAASDELRGSDGGDYLSGFAGNDYLDGGRGDDAVRGGEGKDELDYSSRTANLIVTLDDVQNDGEANERDYAAPDIERVRGGSGNDDIAGSPWLNLLYGNEGDDTLSGGAGADGLYGAGGNDRFDGGPGDDYIEGGAGNDELHGSGGADQLFGLAGNDRIFAAGDGAADVVRGGPGDDGADADELDDLLAVETAL